MALVPLDEVMPEETDQPEQEVPEDDSPEQDEPADFAGGMDAFNSDPNAATPAEQEAVDTAMTAVGTLLFEDEASHTKIMEQLKLMKDNPAKAIAEVAVALTVQVDQASRGTIPRTCIVEIGKQTTEQVGQLANDAKVFPVDQNVLQKAGIAMLGTLADRYDVAPEEVSEFMSRFTPQEREEARASQDALVNEGAPPAPPGQPNQEAGVVPAQGAPLG